jgi:hypothetical protein
MYGQKKCGRRVLGWLTVGTKFEDLNFDILENRQTTANERVENVTFYLGN